MNGSNVNSKIDSNSNGSLYVIGINLENTTAMHIPAIPESVIT